MKVRPDWVCKIFSPSNWRRDTAAQARSPAHYWIVDPEHQELTVYRWSKDGYVVSSRVGPGERAVLEPFRAEFDISVLFAVETPPVI